MKQTFLVMLTDDERWALDTAAVFAQERRKMPEHIERDVVAKIGSAIEKLRSAKPDSDTERKGGDA